MKQFNRLPRWLKVLLPATLVSLCVAINAIAFTEIVESIQARSAAMTARPQLQSPPVDPVEKTVVSTTTVTLPAEPGTQSDPFPSAGAAAVGAEASRKISENVSVNASGTVPANASESRSLEVSPTASLSDSPVPPAETVKYGHQPYAEAEAVAMVPIASYAEGESQRVEMLHPDAAKALFDLVAAARADGLWIVPASGYRTIAQQRMLFDAQIVKTGSPAAAAAVSAPPGYSEHHTGYAVDLADGSLPQNQDISDSFSQTDAYQWLLANAANHGFELSFPNNNPQGISFEPWHWRYVGTETAQVVFGKKQPSVDTRNATDGIVE
ncbi:MAG: M15 family metallopeptidase [Cyanobacteria bacterium J06554_11]